MTIHQALNNATKKLKQKNIPSANLDAEILLLEALNKIIRSQPSPKRKISYPSLKEDKESVIKFTRTFLYSHSNYKLNQYEEKIFNGFISRRLEREPIAYIIGRKEFFGLDFVVNKNVLIPRPETEIIVEEVLKIIETRFIAFSAQRKHDKSPSPRFNLIDVGTGSGCILISVLKNIAAKKIIPSLGNERLEMIRNQDNYALDISREAIEVAKKNAKIILGKNHKIKFIAGDFSKTLNEKILNTSHNLIITANLPYLSENNYQKTQPEIRNFEPRIALTAPKNGLALIKKLLQKIAFFSNELQSISINKNTSQHSPNIFVFLEIDHSQTKHILKFIKNIFPFSKIKIIKDLAKKDRVIKIKIR